jgi:hypothetical protein
VDRSAQPLFGSHLGAYSSIWHQFYPQLPVLFRDAIASRAISCFCRLTNNLFLGVRFPGKDEEPKEETTEVLQQIALSSGRKACGCCRGICPFCVPAPQSLIRLHRPDIWVTTAVCQWQLAGKSCWKVTKTLSAPSHRVIMTTSFRVYHATKQRVCDANPAV